MDAFTVHTGTMAPLTRSDVDTDQIIPSDWLKRVERTGFGAGLFSAWRGTPGFVLDDPRFAGASVLVAGENFGTGSSREHAVWALTDGGFSVIISPRFADIFQGNALKNGLLTVRLPMETVQRLWDLAQADPATAVTVDLEQCTVTAGDVRASFTMDEHDRWRMLNGFDDIGLTLRTEETITAFEQQRAPFLPTTTSATTTTTTTKAAAG